MAFPDCRGLPSGRQESPPTDELPPVRDIDRVPDPRADACIRPGVRGSAWDEPRGILPDLLHEHLGSRVAPGHPLEPSSLPAAVRPAMRSRPRNRLRVLQAHFPG